VYLLSTHKPLTSNLWVGFLCLARHLFLISSSFSLWLRKQVVKNVNSSFWSNIVRLHCILVYLHNCGSIVLHLRSNKWMKMNPAVRMSAKFEFLLSNFILAPLQMLSVWFHTIYVWPLIWETTRKYSNKAPYRMWNKPILHNSVEMDITVQRACWIMFVHLPASRRFVFVCHVIAAPFQEAMSAWQNKRLL